MKKIISAFSVILMIMILMSAAVNAEDYQLDVPKITECESIDEGVRITWDPVDGAELYRVYYKGKKGWTKMGNTTETSFVDTDVKSGGTYLYTVRCLNAEGTVFTSDFDHAGFRYTYNMATPQITKLENTENGVNITWDAVPNAKRYRVYYKNSKGNWVKMTETDKTSYLDKKVSCGSTYTYTVRCVNDAGKRFTSSFNDKGWKHTYYLPTPQITGFRSIGKGVEINWDKINGAEKYRLYYKNENGNWVKMGESTGTSFIDTNVDVGSTKTYTIRCINNDLTKFTSDHSKSGWKYTYDPQLDTPKISKVEAVKNGIEIHWKAVDGADTYRVYNKGSKGWTKIGDVRDTSYTYTDVSPGNTYTFTIRCLSRGGKNFASDYDHSGTKFYLYKNPEIEDMTVYMDRIELNVFATRCHNVRIYRKNGSSWTRIGEIDSEEDSSFADYNVEPGKTYTYTARCTDGNGAFASYFNTSGWKQTYSLSECYPELEYFMYSGEEITLTQPKEDNKFGIEQYYLHVLLDGYYCGTFELTNEPNYLWADFFYKDQEYLVYLVGVDSNGNEITQMNGFMVRASESPTAPYDPEPIDPEPQDSEFLTAYENKVISLVNEERAKAGVPALSANSQATEIAHIRAKELVESFSHTRPDGRRCFTAADDLGVRYNSAGENIAYGQESPQAVVNAWMNSEGHRNNILNANFKKIGVGCYEKNGTLYWVQFFMG